MAVIKITDPSGKITSILHNRRERRQYEKRYGVKIKPAGTLRLRSRTRILPARRVTSREPFGGSGPSEKAAARAAVRAAR